MEVSAQGERRTADVGDARERARVLDATVECVAELGYGQATMDQIARRAGVPRRALRHQFQTRSELMIAALDWAMERRQEEFREAFNALPPDRRTLSNALDLLWAAFQRPTFMAWLELAIAMRTYPSLTAHVREVTERFEHRSRALFAELFPNSPHTEQSVRAVSLAFTVLNGAALERNLGVGIDTDGVIELLKGFTWVLSGG